MMSPIEHLVSEITVEGHLKNWGEYAGIGGLAQGSVVTMTVIPKDENKKGWTSIEAQIVAAEVRQEIHVFLMADAEMRAQKLPPGAHQTLEEYKTLVERLKSDFPR